MSIFAQKKIMKKIILTLTVSFAMLAQSAYAQIRFDLGVKGGLNFAGLSNVSTSNLKASYENRTGYHFGAYAMIKITKFAIQPEIIFSRQGQNYTLPNSTSNLTSNFDYINIPVMVKFYVAGGLNLQAGPQFGFLSSATGDVINTVNGSISSTTSSADLKTFVKSSDVSLAVGAGWDLPFGLNLTARYNIGLSDINQKTGGIIPSVGNSTISSLGTSEAKSQVVQISVGYRFIRLGK
jgi:hypothetical protein